MYNGKKDWKPQLEVPANLCYAVQMSNGVLIEVRIPVKGVPEAEYRAINGETVTYINWKSIMVSPDQVFHKTDTVNVIEGINQGASLKLYNHYSTSDGRYLLDKSTYEACDIFELMSRINAFYI